MRSIRKIACLPLAGIGRVEEDGGDDTGPALLLGAVAQGRATSGIKMSTLWIKRSIP
jgi:hypothetical protein